MHNGNFTKLNRLNFEPLAQNLLLPLPLNFTCFDILSYNYSKQDIVGPFTSVSILKSYFEIVGGVVNPFLAIKGLCNQKTNTRFSMVEVPSRVLKFLDELEFP